MRPITNTITNATMKRIGKIINVNKTTAPMTFCFYELYFLIIYLFAVIDLEIVAYRSRCKGAAKSALTAVRSTYLFCTIH